MTTIACNRKMMACDSMHAWSYTKYKSLRPKIWAFKGGIFGFAGCGAEIQRFRKWFENGCDDNKKNPDENNSIAGIILKECGIEIVDALWDIEPIDHDFWAVGTGKDYAIGAMHCGATPDESIDVASMYDINTSNPTVSLWLSDIFGYAWNYMSPPTSKN